MIVCICHRVSDRDIARAAQGGCDSFDELQFELSVATSCGRCHECAHSTFLHHVAQVKNGSGAATCGVTPSRPTLARIAVLPHHHAAQASGA